MRDFNFIAIKDRLAAYRKASDAACKAFSCETIKQLHAFTIQADCC